MEILHDSENFLSQQINNVQKQQVIFQYMHINQQRLCQQSDLNELYNYSSRRGNLIPNSNKTKPSSFYLFGRNQLHVLKGLVLLLFHQQVLLPQQLIQALGTVSADNGALYAQQSEMVGVFLYMQVGLFVLTKLLLIQLNKLARLLSQIGCSTCYYSKLLIAQHIQMVCQCNGSICVSGSTLAIHKVGSNDTDRINNCNGLTDSDSECTYVTLFQCMAGSCISLSQKQLDLCVLRRNTTRTFRGFSITYEPKCSERAFQQILSETPYHDKWQMDVQQNHHQHAPQNLVIQQHPHQLQMIHALLIDKEVFLIWLDVFNPQPYVQITKELKQHVSHQKYFIIINFQFLGS